VVVDIDTEMTPGGGKVRAEYCPDGGNPAWAILGPDRKVLADSMRDKRNVGFPYEPDEVAHFFDALRKSCPRLAEDEVKVLKERLAEHGKAAKAKAKQPKEEPGQH
jgi:hypothetical protein